MKTTITRPDKEKKFDWKKAKYPIMGLAKGDGRIVLFSEYAKGTCIHIEDDYVTSFVGEYYEEWVMEEFKPLEKGAKVVIEV